MVLFRYMNWLHTRWPAGTVERLPVVEENGRVNVAGVRVVGDLTGIPLLKFSSDTGAKAVEAMLAEPDFRPTKDPKDDVLDLAIIGAGVSGISAAIAAQKAGLHFVLYEASEAFSTVVNFPKGKPIYTYPTEMVPAGIQFTKQVKEELLDEMEEQRRQAGVEVTKARIDHLERRGGELVLVHSDKKKSETRARRVIVGIGRSGNFRKLGVPGEEKAEKVFNRLHDPKEFAGRHVLVVGGGDSALEAAIALACTGAHVTLSYRKKEFARPKPDNIEKIEKLVANPAAKVGVEEPTSERVTTSAFAHQRKSANPGSLTLKMATNVVSIEDDAVTLKSPEGVEERLPNDVVFTMLGRAAPLEFFRRSGIAIHGEWRLPSIIGLALFFAFCIWLYHWKSYNFTIKTINPAQWTAALAKWIGAAAADRKTLIYTILKSASGPSFYYTLAYCTLVITFGIRRIRKRRTPYITRQTITLMLVQVIPLFILPEIILPWMGRNELFTNGHALKGFADLFFEPYDGKIGIERAYWRSYGFILAWPLMVYNFFTSSPMWGWLVLGSIQTFVVIPALIYRYGKGAYCGWICSCGALAETLGDEHRTKMPHGPKWNRVNMLGQVILLGAFVLLALRMLSWWGPMALRPTMLKIFNFGFTGGSLWGIPLNYKWIVDVMLAGVVGVGFYFWFSGRVWCRFACPLAALMHIYARFSRFRIFAEKKKCISCNVCTSVCHQGIDIMNFANKGLPMQDPECVRCSACVQSCPTGTLSFGRIGSGGSPIYDRFVASPVQLREPKGKSLPQAR
ncbi:MAG: NAD(P)-binding domain-containing protein [Myxococcales bacterium]|nr:NAD(P)-binding domain-containing protein [Myxococcales bacterium]